MSAPLRAAAAVHRAAQARPSDVRALAGATILARAAPVARGGSRRRGSRPVWRSGSAGPGMPRRGVTLEAPLRVGGGADALAAEVRARHTEGATFAALATALCAGAEAAQGGGGGSVADELLAVVEVFVREGVVGGPLVHCLLETVERTCAPDRPRRAFAATRQAPHVACEAARSRAARMVAAAAAINLGSCGGDGTGGSGGRALEPRAVARVAHVVGLTREDLVEHSSETGADVVAAFAARLVSARKTATPACSLALTFELEAFAQLSTLDRLVEHDAMDLAESFARHLDSDARHHLVRTLIDRELYKQAHRCCGTFGLSSSYPQARLLYGRQTITKLASKGRWEIAVERASEDTELQRLVVELRAAAGDAGEAALLQARFGFDVTFSDAENSTRIRDSFLELGIPREHVRLVTDESGVLEACEWLRTAEIIGLDSEWRPTTSKKGGSRPVALLQISCARRAYLFDMVALRAQEEALRALDAGLYPLMASAKLNKLGYAVIGDFKKLRSSYALRAFHEVRGVVDVGAVHSQLTGQRAPGGLAGLCKVVLGKPLDKSVTCSNWEARPLCERQVLYASNDAHCCVRLWDALCAEHGAEAVHAASEHVMASSVAPYDASRPPWRGADVEGAPSPPLSPGDGEAAVRAAMCAALPAERFVITRSPSGAGSMNEVAASLGVPCARVVKSIACVVEDAAAGNEWRIAMACLLLLSGSERAALAVVAERLGVARKSLRLCTPEECGSLFGYVPGSVPAVGLRRMPEGVQLTVLMSESVAASQETVFTGGGSVDAHVEITPANLLLAAGAHVAPIVAAGVDGQGGGHGGHAQ